MSYLQGRFTLGKGNERGMESLTPEFCFKLGTSSNRKARGASSRQSRRPRHERYSHPVRKTEDTRPSRQVLCPFPEDSSCLGTIIPTQPFLLLPVVISKEDGSRLFKNLPQLVQGPLRWNWRLWKRSSLFWGNLSLRDLELPRAA